jgi:hypothetical protein
MAIPEDELHKHIELLERAADRSFDGKEAATKTVPHTIPFLLTIDETLTSVLTHAHQ